MNEKFKISKYLFLFKKGSYVVLYNALSLKKLYGGELLEGVFNFFKKPKKINKAARFPKDIIDKLIDMKFLISLDYNEDQIRDNLIKISNKINPITLKFLITDECNYHCRYCQIEENIPHKNKNILLSKINAKKALDLFVQNCPKKIEKTIIFTGGEPLLNYQVLKYIVNEAKKRIDNVRIVVFTNGSLINEEIAKYFKKNKILVLISIDGPKDIHDKERKFLFGKGTYDKTIHGYQICKKIGCKVGISSVIGPHNINKFDELIYHFIQLKPESIGVNFPHLLLNKNNSHLIDMNKYTYNLIRMFLTARREGLFIEQVSRKLRPFIEEKPNHKACIALGKGVTITPEGIVGPCKTLLTTKTHGKSINNFNNIAEDRDFKKWSKRSTLTMKGCEHCACIGVCGTGCTYDSYVLYKDINHIDPRACVFSKRFLEFMIWDLFRFVKKRVEIEKFVEPTLEERKKMYGDINQKSGLAKTVGH